MFTCKCIQEQESLGFKVIMAQFTYLLPIFFWGGGGGKLAFWGGGGGGRDFPGYPYETLLHMDCAGYTISQYWLINLLTWDISQQRLPHSYVKCPFLCLHKQLINSPKPEFPSSSFSN